jgi:hypothetical protein
MMNLTPSQQVTARQIKTSLARREFVCLFGNKANGKTYTHHSLMNEFSAGIESRVREKIIPSDAKGYTLDLMKCVEVSTISDRLELDRLRRQILRYFGDRSTERNIEMRRRFIKLLLDLKKAKIMPVIANDSIELVPRRGLLMLKTLWETTHGEEHIGPACLLSGDLMHHRLEENFWSHATVIKMGKILAEEVRTLADQVIPEYKDYFTEPVLRRIGELPSVAEMKKTIRATADYWENYSDQTLIGLDALRGAQNQIEQTRSMIVNAIAA